MKLFKTLRRKPTIGVRTDYTAELKLVSAIKSWNWTNGDYLIHTTLEEGVCMYELSVDKDQHNIVNLGKCVLLIK